MKRAVLLGVLGLLTLPRPAAAASPCERSLWGCPATDKRPGDARDPQARYEQLCAHGRRALRFVQTSGQAVGRRELNDTLPDLVEATRLAPEQPEGWALLGVIRLDLGQWEEAEPALQRALSAGEDGSAVPGGLEGDARGGARTERPGLLAGLDPQLETLTITGLSFIQAQRGDLSGAVERTRRLLLRRGLSHRTLFRLGDLLMAQGSLDEATASYERACTLPRTAATTTLELSRACHGLLVALDRGERARASFFLRRATALDGDHRAIEMADLYPPCDREYYRALTLASGCARRAAFQAYLRQAGKQPGVPSAYLRRAEEHLRAENNLSCPPEL